MEYQELLGKYNLLQRENKRLREENRQLRIKLGEQPPPVAVEEPHTETSREPVEVTKPPNNILYPSVTFTSNVAAKIELFLSLFKGQEDVYARRWENVKTGKSGYTPVCLNRRKPGLCGRPRTPCSKCSHHNYAKLDEDVIRRHLLGEIVVGLYPLLNEDTCWFLAMDFDGDGWCKDVDTVRAVCNDFRIPIAVERSRSGSGGHAWFFFEQPVPADLARKFGSALLTTAMNLRHEIRFTSYDRLFPSQDTLPRGGFGNLIALPLQKMARENQNSEFVNETFDAYPDQWAFLAAITRLTKDRLSGLVTQLCRGRELGELRIDPDESVKPWMRHTVKLKQSDFPIQLDITRADMVYVPKDGFSQRALNRLKRLASFRNPAFYKQQALRLSTFKIPRIISCADETPEYLCLPRGCEDDLFAELAPFGITINVTDLRNMGRTIEVEFNGFLRDEQPLALEQLLKHDTGILCGTTAFGKTVVAIKLIAERKVNTLILVDKTTLASQWREKLEEFLIIHETLPQEKQPKKPRKRGRKKKNHLIGQLGGGKDTLNGIVDIAIMQSVSRQGVVRDCVRNYGMVIADECHHASAFTYEQILRTTNARYVYGLTATPTRKDGHHPILNMHLGAIRYRDDARKQAQKRPFEHYVIPRFTSLSKVMDNNDDDISIQQWYTRICEDEFRNEQLIEDVLQCYRDSRNALVLSLRTAHVELLAAKIKLEVPNVVTLTGALGARQSREALKQISEAPVNRNLVIVATGPFIGEGFDEPRLDTLFLAMPISWKGTLQQYAGRLHRLVDQKKEVRIYDYVDVQVRMLEKMYQKRLKGYASMGYKVKGENLAHAPAEIIFDQNNFLPVFRNDILCAQKEILIVSPFLRKRRTAQMIEVLVPAVERKVSVNVISRPSTDFNSRDQIPFRNALNLFDGLNIKISHQSNIHQKFAVIDRKIVWYGSVNLLSFGSARESLMRIESANIARELEKAIDYSS